MLRQQGHGSIAFPQTPHIWPVMTHIYSSLCGYGRYFLRLLGMHLDKGRRIPPTPGSWRNTMWSSGDDSPIVGVLQRYEAP